MRKPLYHRRLFNHRDDLEVAATDAALNGACVGFFAFDVRLFDEERIDDTMDDLQHRRQQTGCRMQLTRAQAQAEYRRLVIPEILLDLHAHDLMQMHNVGFLDRKMVASQLAILREWKTQGLFRYIGVTHSQDQARANERLIEMLRTGKLDFIQVNYSMAERSVEDRLLAVASETGTAVLCNLPYARGALFRAVQG